ncbi:glycosyltransferase [Granulicella sp. dw_53]|uniref:glycosyltransferase n=1 Tax=Granulicella sp. dw_53 TaxID=2719792 RepID=UPI001BD43AA6|nr:glycosyltransferase [Granulicella sp. dw_53]
MIFAFAVVSFGIWLWLLAGHGGFWRSGPVLGVATPVVRRLKVTAVVPARNEAEHVVEMLRSLLAQRFDGDLRVVLVDDNSTDGTGELARELAAGDARLRVVSGEPLKAGWSGKMWTVSQGLRQAEALEADYVLLADADIVHGPGHVELLLSKAEREGLGLVSEMVRLRCEGFAERATIPAFVFFFQMLYPFRWVNDKSRATAAAAGGTMLVSREALDRVGGVDRIRGALIDDVALAREIKREGYGIWLGHAEETWSGRRYADFGEVWEMIARTAYVQLGYSPWMLLGTCVGMMVIYVEPVLASLFRSGAVRGLGVICWMMMAAAFQPTLRRYRRSPLWGLALPAIALFYTAATVGSAVRSYRGQGGRWKDRVYPAGI